MTLIRQVLEESEQKNGKKHEIQVKLIFIIRPRTCYYFCRLVTSIRKGLEESEQKKI